MRFDQTRAMIATIKHDLVAGNVEKAQRILGELVRWPGDVRQATPAMIRECCAGIEAKLAEMGL